MSMKTVLKLLSLSALALLTPPALFLVYSACFKKKGCVCSYYFWEKRNTIAPHLSLPSERCDVCWRPKNILSARNGLRWPYGFLGFFPPSFGGKYASLLCNGTYTVNPWRESFSPESSVAWLQRSQVIREAWTPFFYRFSFWRYSLLRGMGRPVFCRKSADTWGTFSSGIVEKYIVSVIPEQDTVSLHIVDIETKESRLCLLDPIPPRRNLINGECFFSLAEFFDDSFVLLACEVAEASFRIRIWAYKYVPDRKNSEIWKMKSAKKIDVPTPDVNLSMLSPWYKVGKYTVGLSCYDVETEGDPLHVFVYDIKEESWRIILDTDLPGMQNVEEHRAFKAFKSFRETWRAMERYLFRYIGNLCSRVEDSEDDHFEGFLVSAPPSFAPQNLAEDKSCKALESSPGLFLVPGNNPSSLHSLAFRSLIKDHPSLLEGIICKLRQILKHHLSEFSSKRR